MTAPALATMIALGTHADLADLFAREQSAFSSEYQPIVDLVQADAARDLGVDLAQGWHLGRPARPLAP